MASNADNFPNDSETLSASAQQFHNILFDDQNLTYENLRPSIVFNLLIQTMRAPFLKKLMIVLIYWKRDLRKELHVVCSVFSLWNFK